MAAAGDREGNGRQGVHPPPKNGWISPTKLLYQSFAVPHLGMHIHFIVAQTLISRCSNWEVFLGNVFN